MIIRSFNKYILNIDIEAIRTSPLEFGEGPTKCAVGLSSPSHITLDKLPGHLIALVLLHEDSAFFNHTGFHWQEIQRRVWEYLIGEGKRGGGSSITQQLARHIFCLGSTNLLRKIIEVLITIDLESTFSKQEILELFLSSVFTGVFPIGIQRFTQIYFDKSPSQLTLEESMYLTQVIQSPTTSLRRDIGGEPLDEFNFHLSFTKFRDLLLYYYTWFGSSSISEDSKIGAEQVVKAFCRSPYPLPDKISPDIFTIIETRAALLTLNLKLLIKQLPERVKKHITL